MVRKRWRVGDAPYFSTVWPLLCIIPHLAPTIFPPPPAPELRYKARSQNCFSSRRIHRRAGKDEQCESAAAKCKFSTDPWIARSPETSWVCIEHPSINLSPSVYGDTKYCLRYASRVEPFFTVRMCAIWMISSWMRGKNGKRNLLVCWVFWLKYWYSCGNPDIDFWVRSDENQFLEQRRWKSFVPIYWIRKQRQSMYLEKIKFSLWSIFHLNCVELFGLDEVKESKNLFQPTFRCHSDINFTESFNSN